MPSRGEFYQNFSSFLLSAESTANLFSLFVLVLESKLACRSSIKIKDERTMQCRRYSNVADAIGKEDILLLHDLYTKCYLVTQSSNKLLKTYSPEDLMQLSPSKLQATYLDNSHCFGKLCDLLRGDSIFYNNSRHIQIALEIQVAVGLSRLGSNGNGASIGKIQMIFGVGEGTVVLYTNG
ncbi:hypothetical protein BY996DRAFT_8546971, partial [Phakopsora pachyrhizi]